MSATLRDTHGLDAMIGLLRDGSLTDADADRLDALLRHDAAAQRYYAEQVLMMAELRRAHAGSAAGATGRRSDEATQGLDAAAEALPVSRSAFGVPSFAYALAASLVVAMAIVAVYFSLRPAAEPVGPTPIAPHGPVLAVLAEASSVAWASEPIDAGDEVSARSVAIDRGTLAFDLLGGTTMWLRGPAVAQIQTRDRALLSRGEATFRATPGFTVTTPSGVRVTDLGTEFAVTVADTGRTWVQTKQGRVRVDLPGGASRVLDAGLAVHIWPDAGGFTDAAFDTEPRVAAKAARVLHAGFDRPSRSQDESPLDDAWSVAALRSGSVERITGDAIHRDGAALSMTTTAGFQRLIASFDPASLDAIGATVRLSLRCRIDPAALTVIDDRTVSFRMGLYDSADSESETDYRGYRLDLRLHEAGVPILAKLTREQAGDNPLGGNVFGDTLAAGDPAAPADAHARRVVLQVQRVAGGIRLLGIIDQRIVLDHTDKSSGAFARFDRMVFGTGNLTGRLVFDDVSVTTLTPVGGAPASPAKPSDTENES